MNDRLNITLQRASRNGRAIMHNIQAMRHPIRIPYVHNHANVNIW